MAIVLGAVLNVGMALDRNVSNAECKITLALLLCLHLGFNEMSNSGSGSRCRLQLAVVVFQAQILLVSRARPQM